jgi:FlaA1/EpsC-like NDP-sugar epimerase
VILHAAAHKHLPLMESNPTEAIRNNVVATRLLAGLAGEYEVETFVLVSTDKAVRPTSVMGASKRLAELVIQDLDQRSATRFLAVRFGNVLGSTGSVIPIFREQIAAGGPVTVTHPDMVRYFMTIPEAAELVLQAGAIGRGGEIFILDMGEPVRILELAKDMITLSGLKPYEDIDIVVTGARRGEKLFEELELSGEALERTRHPKIFVGRLAGLEHERLARGIDELRELVQFGLQEEIRSALSRLVPEARLVESASRPVGGETAPLARSEAATRR